jgi:hypothetical protein
MMPGVIRRGRCLLLAACCAALTTAAGTAPATAAPGVINYEFRIVRISLRAADSLEINRTEKLTGGTETTKESVTRTLEISYRGTARDEGVFSYGARLPRGVPVGGVQTRRTVPATIRETGPWEHVFADDFGHRNVRSGTCGGVFRERRAVISADFESAGPRVKVDIPLYGLAADFARECLQEPSLARETDHAAATLGVGYLRRTRTIVIPVRFKRTWRAEGTVERLTWSGEIVARRTGTCRITRQGCV